MLRSALSTLVVVLAVPTFAQAHGGAFGMFDFTDTTSRPIVMGFDLLDNPTDPLIPDGTDLAGFYSLQVPENDPAYATIVANTPWAYDAQLFPGNADNVSTGPCLAPAFVVRSQSGYGWCRSVSVVHNNMAQPSPATGYTNDAFEANPIQRYYPDTVLDNPDGDAAALEGRADGELPDLVVAGSLNPYTDVINSRPYLERTNRLLAGTFTYPAAPTWPGVPSGPGYAQVTVPASDWRSFIDTTGSLITDDPLPYDDTIYPVNDVPWTDLQIIFELATGHATMYSTGTVDTSIGRLPFRLLYTTRTHIPINPALLGGLPGVTGLDLFTPFGMVSSSGAPVVIPGDTYGVQEYFSADTPLSFFCTYDDPSNGSPSIPQPPPAPPINLASFRPFGPVPCIPVATDTVGPGDNVINMFGISFAGSLPATTSAGDLAFWEAPEPGTGLLLGAAVAGLALLRRKLGA